DIGQRYHAELANGFGNLASRAAAMVGKYFDGRLPAPGDHTDAETAITSLVATAVADAEAAIDRIAPHEAVASVWRIVDALNGYITEQQPWVLAKDDAQRERLGTVLHTVIEGLRVLAVTLHPVMPKS